MTPATKALIEKHACKALVAELLGVKPEFVQDCLDGGKKLSKKDDERVISVINRRFKST